MNGWNRGKCSFDNIDFFYYNYWIENLVVDAVICLSRDVKVLH